MEKYKLTDIQDTWVEKYGDLFNVDARYFSGLQFEKLKRDLLDALNSDQTSIEQIETDWNNRFKLTL